MGKKAAMFYHQIKDATPAHFKRLTGVRRSTFADMVRLVDEKHPHFGRPRALALEDQVLMTLMYWREYRTQFHIGASYGVSEATVSRTVRRVEDVLIKSGRFSLPGKRALVGSDARYEVVLVDATETPCERPKKSSVAVTGSVAVTAARRSVTR